MKKIVINKCFGGYSLSYKALMRYAELSGFELYAFADNRDKNGRFQLGEFVPYEKGDDAFCIHYNKKPLRDDGSYDEDTYFSGRYDIERDDEILIRVVEELGEKANGSHAELEVVEIPDNVEWGIHEYDGLEHVEEKHRTWG